MTNFNDFLKEQLKDPAFKAEWDALDPEFSVIEAMLKNELDRLPMEELNDMQERTVPIQGGGLFLVEWDNNQRTSHTITKENIFFIFL